MATPRKTGTEGETNPLDSQTRRWTLGILIGVIVVLSGLVIGMFALAGRQTTYRAELLLPMLLCLGTALLILICRW